MQSRSSETEVSVSNVFPNRSPSISGRISCCPGNIDAEKGGCVGGVVRHLTLRKRERQHPSCSGDRRPSSSQVDVTACGAASILISRDSGGLAESLRNRIRAG